MMNTTLFAEYVKKWFKMLVTTFVETTNGSKKGLTYLFKTMLKPELSTDFRWDSLSINSSIVAADVVAMDSPLPLKKRDAIETASGTIPKLGMKLSKSEKLLADIQVLAARGVAEEQIVQKIFEDVPKCISGIDERLEYMFLRALSTGVMLVPQEENVGAGVRVNFGYKDSNRFGALASAWGNTGATPLSDMAHVISKAEENGDYITTVLLDKASYNLARQSAEAKALYAGSTGNFTGNAQTIPIPSQFNALVKDEYGVDIVVIDRSVRYEKDGKQTPVKPFAENTVVFLTAPVVGRLVYGTLVEEGSPVAGVTYQKAGAYTLVSKYSKNDPLREFTSSQALALPVIDNVAGIYILDTRDAQEIAATETEGDANITLYGKALAKADVIAALKSLDVKVAANIGDAKLIAKINELSDEQEDALKQALGIEG
jgi:hypothetical protein